MVMAIILNMVFLVGVIITLLSFVGWWPWKDDYET